MKEKKNKFFWRHYFIQFVCKDDMMEKPAKNKLKSYFSSESGGEVLILFALLNE
jgi:hypothetical protein